MAITYTISAEFSTGVWTDITADILAEAGIRTNQGIRGNGPTDRVASTGTLKFALDNSRWNSGGLAGYYSPGHTNCRAGFEEGLRVRLYLTNGTYSNYLFFGRITDINPVPGKFGPLRTDITACDYFDLLATENIPGLAVLTGVTGDDVLTEVIGNVSTPPGAYAFEVGPDVFPYAGHSENAQKTKALTVLQKAVQSDMGFLVMHHSATNPEWLVYKNRHKRYTLTSAGTLTETDIDDMTVSRSKDKTYNSISVTVYPVRVDSSPVVLGEAQNEIVIAPGETLEIRISYKDPNQPAVKVSASSVIAPEAETDYRMASIPGGGSNLTGDLSITLEDGANQAILTLENTGLRMGYINRLQVRGYGLYFDDPVTITEESGDADRPVNINLPYQADPVRGQAIAQRLLTKYGTAQTRAESVTFTASNATLEAHAINRVIIHRITLSESQAGISGDYFIQSMTHEIGPGGVVTVTWELDYETDIDNYWLLGDATHSILGSTTYPVI